MSIDIAALDQLPETDPVADLGELGLLECSTITCWFFSCLISCRVTES